MNSSLPFSLGYDLLLVIFLFLLATSSSVNSLFHEFLDNSCVAVMPVTTRLQAK